MHPGMTFSSIHENRHRQSPWVEPAMDAFRHRYDGVSRKVLAEDVGVPRGTVDSWFNRRSRPSKMNQIKFWRFCKKVGIEVPSVIQVGKRIIEK